MKTKYLVITSILALSLTAQACVFNSSGSGPKGAWKSTDGGESWKRSNLVDSGKNSTTVLDNIDVRSFAMAPDRQDVIYAATPIGVFASDSAAELWHHVLPNVQVRDLAIAESDSQIIYASGLANERGVVYKSSNRGLDWDIKYTEVSSNEASAIAVNPRDYNHVLVGTNQGTLMSSFDGGETWALIRKMTGRIQQIEFHPIDPRRVYILLYNGGLLASDNGGNSFNLITASTKRVEDDETGLDYRPSKYFSFDFDIANSNVIYLTTNSGLFKTTNAGVTWSVLRLPVDPRNASTLGIEVGNGGELIYVNINTVVYKSTDGGRTFNVSKLATNRLIRALVIPRGVQDVVYAGLIE